MLSERFYSCIFIRSISKIILHLHCTQIHLVGSVLVLQGVVSKFRVQTEAVSTLKFLPCYPHATSLLPTELLIPSILSDHLSHFLMLVGLDGLCAVTYLFIVSCVCPILHLALTFRSITSFQNLPCLDHVSLAWIWLPPPFVPSAALGLPVPAPHSTNSPLLLASSFPAGIGESGERESTLE